jgi:hypothetical protein
MSTQSTGTGSATGEPNVVVIRQRAGWGGRILVIIGLIGLLCAGYLALSTVSLIPKIHNPFAAQTQDKSSPVVLQSIQDLSLFVAARGNFQVVVDYQQDHAYVPDFISSYHALFVGVGSVDATVDFSKLSQGAIQVSGDGKQVTVTLPEPQLSDVHLDINQSHVYSLDTGLLDKIQSLVTADYNQQGQLYQLASDKIKQAAIQSELVQRAEDNTRITLEGMLKSLGYERVTINFQTNPA